MDLQTRKLNVIEYIAGLQDENIFNSIDITISENKVRNERHLKTLKKHVAANKQRHLPANR